MARRRLGAAAAGGAAALLSGLVLAGCGGSASTAAGTTAAAAAGTGFAAFQTCLKAHGVTPAFGRGRGAAGAPPPAGGRPNGGTRPRGGGPPNASPKQRSAFQACRSKLPAGSARGRRPTGSGGASSAAIRKYTDCLKQHGVTFGAAGGTAKFQAAAKACASLAPGGAPATK